MPVRVEAAVETVEAAVLAARAGVDRLELCADLKVGGTTPRLALVKEVCAATALPVYVMVRPRGGDFTYTADEIPLMARTIEVMRATPCAGIVTGVIDSRPIVQLEQLHLLGGSGLRVRARVHLEQMRTLLSAAGDLPVTFHRAFDAVNDQWGALEDLGKLGVRRILTSGGASSAADGANRIATLVQRGGERITIIAGGGVRAHNVREIITQTGVREVHARFESEDQMRRLVEAARG